MTRHALAKGILDAVLGEAEAGPVELTRDGQPVAVVLSMADYERLTSVRTPSFWEALERFREETDLDELDIDDILERRDRSTGREIKL